MSNETNDKTGPSFISVGLDHQVPKEVEEDMVSKAKLNVKTYGVGFEVPKEVAESFQATLNDHIAQFERGLWDDAFSGPRPIVPPTRRQRLRTWLAMRLLRVVEWLDTEVIPYD